MTFTQKRLSGPAQLTTSSAQQYIVPANTTTIVKQILITNTTASSKTVSIRLVPLNVAESNTHEIFSNVTIAANETLSFGCSLVLINNGNTSNTTNSDSIKALASANSAVNLTIFGIEET